MRHLVFTEPGRLEWQDAPDPQPPADGVVLRPTAVARCDLDVPMAGFGLFPGPFAVGHEAVGEVVAVGPQVQRWRAGDTALVPFQVSCGDCPSCHRRRFAACEPHRASAGAAFGFGPAGGGHPGAVADLLPIPHADHLLLAPPSGLDPRLACLLADNAVDGWRAVAPALQSDPGSDVLVVGGLGPSVALFAIVAARGAGAGSVTYVDDDPARLDAARHVGATTIDTADGWPERLPRAAVVVENTGTPDGLTAAIRATAPYGTCTSVAIHFDSPVSLPLLSMYTKGITFHTSRADARRFLPQVLEAVEEGHFDLSSIPTTVVDWPQADQAWMSPATKLVLARGDT